MGKDLEVADVPRFSHEEIVEETYRIVEEMPEPGGARIAWLESILFNRLRFQALLVVISGLGEAPEGFSQLPDPEEDFGVVFREISEFFSSAELKAVHNYGLKALPEDRFLKLWRYPGTLARLSRVLRNSNSAYWLPIIRAQDGSR